MAITKEKKKNILAKLKDIIKKAKSVSFVNFHGLSVLKAVELRKVLKTKKVGYFVAKKSLIKKAFEGEKIEGEFPSLDGEVAVAFSDDAVSSNREIFSFGKKIEVGLKLMGGIFEGRFIGKEKAEEIALIPSEETLRTQFVQLIKSPIQRLVVSLGEIAKKKTS